MQRWLFGNKRDTRFENCGKFDTILPFIDKLESKEAELAKEAMLKEQERETKILALNEDFTENPDIDLNLEKSIDEMKYEVIASFNGELNNLINAFNQKKTKVTDEEVSKFYLELSSLIITTQTHNTKILKQQRNDNKETANAVARTSLNVTGMIATLAIPPTIITKIAAFSLFGSTIKKANHTIREKTGLTDKVASSWRILEEMGLEVEKMNYKILQVIAQPSGPQSQTRKLNL